jgi:hypothetical protein
MSAAAVKAMQIAQTEQFLISQVCLKEGAGVDAR